MPNGNLLLHLLAQTSSRPRRASRQLLSRSSIRTRDDDSVLCRIAMSRQRTPLSPFSPMSWLLLEELSCLPRRRRFWTAHPLGEDVGTWEAEVTGTWARLGVMYPDVEEKKFAQRYRVNKPTFKNLLEKLGHVLVKEDTNMRSSIGPQKRLAIFLHWLAHGCEYHELAAEYRIGTSTVHQIIHDILPAVCALAETEILFPNTPSALETTMLGFQHLSGVPGCAGAIDGTFMAINKPIVFGDAYYCYKHFPSILLLVCVNSTGLITYASAGLPGSVGDAAAYNMSKLKENIESGVWLSCAKATVCGQQVPPFIVGDAAFSFSSQMMKCYANRPQEQTDSQRRFNYCIIRTRRVVENAFGRLKARWRIVVKNFIRDPKFAGNVAVAACILHNVCERSACPFDNEWLVDDTVAVNQQGNEPTAPGHNQDIHNHTAEGIRSLLAQHVSIIHQ